MGCVRGEIIPSIRLITIPHNPKKQTPDKPIEPDMLPPLVLVLLARFHAEQPAGGRVIMVFMGVVARFAKSSGGEGSPGLGNDL